MFQEIEIGCFLNHPVPLIDVRSPGEYLKGHIPGAVNVPLFSDEERAVVGTAYVKQSKEKAIELGYRFVYPKLDHFIAEANRIAPEGRVAVHCWRGGMRSHAFAQHLSENGFHEVNIITGGYKSYRNYLLESFASPFHLRIIGGYTGSGKTAVLGELIALGQQAVDLEGLACHKGSAFGGIGQKAQPTVEQFENNLFEVWRHLDFSKPIWLEDESHNIGGVNIPMNLFNQMRQAKLYFLNIPKPARARHLVDEYGQLNKSELITSINLITRRLGGEATKQAILCLEAGNLFEVANLSLNYYDKSYLKGIRDRVPESITTLDFETIDPRLIAQTLIKTDRNE